ncbi:MAG TPA: FtsX-like permease family protein [Puia sp.]|nr:FtsX-like permease family protein [Puia sp.]
MIKSYLQIAWRNLRKNKLYTFVNIIGLTIGISSCLLIGLYIGHELSYDRFNERSDRIARVTMEYSVGGVVSKATTTGTKVGPQFKRIFPAVEEFSRTLMMTRIISYQGNIFTEKKFLYADSGFFRIFSFKLLAGDPATALNAPDHVLMSSSMAKKYFGNDNPVGKVLQVANNNSMTVSGVFQDVPDNSQLRFDFLGSFSSLDVAATEEWWTANYITYLLLREPGQLEKLHRQVADYMKTPEVRREARLDAGDYLTYQLEPLLRVHLHSSLEGWSPNGNITYVYTLGIIAVLILIIACVNYTNLATAQSAGRTGEISVRKVLGARPAQLFGQYLGESALLTAIALLLAVGAGMLLLPVFNQLSDKSLSLSVLTQPLPLLCLVILYILVSLLAGAYPAFVLSHIKLVNMLKSGFRFSSSGNGLRKSLIIFQFVISVFLIISTIVILQQLSFIQNRKLGYDKEHIVVLPVDWRMHRDYEEIKKAITLDPRIIRVGGANQNPVFVQWTDGLQSDQGNGKKNMTIKCIPSDLDFIKAMGIQIIAGTDFTRSDFYKMDTTDHGKNFRYSFILNETAAKALGWKPDEAVGKTVQKEAPGVVKAVVKDFHFASLHEPISPLMIFLDTQWVSQLFVKISGNDIPGTLNYLQKVWKERVPYRPFEYHFLDEDYNALYKVETRTGQLFSIFSSTAIVLACLGLFALAAYTTVQRTREIGIRKVLGATPAGIAGLLSADFLKLVVIAAFIAFPVAWWAMHQWLDDFAYRVNIQWWVFLAAALLALLIALVSVSSQAIRAALVNPVKSLRSE